MADINNAPPAQRPLILLTNDDGVSARGLVVMAEHLARLGEVFVSAPAREMSAVGHGISLTRALRAELRHPGCLAVDGTPVDAVLLAMLRFCKRTPELVVSGINRGPNLGTDVFYSGTVAGALEGALRGVQAFAISQELPPRGEDPDGTLLERYYQRTARFGAAMAGHLLRRPLPERTVLNINAPAAEGDQFAVTTQGVRIYRERVVERTDLMGGAYYWLGGPPVQGVNPPGTDGYAVEAGLISVTPLGLDLSHRGEVLLEDLDLGGFTVGGGRGGVDNDGRT